jgi:uncharacterized protein YdeI (YjbR/CyaY-like superfamily)
MAQSCNLNSHIIESVKKMQTDDLPMVEFENQDRLHQWLSAQPPTSKGVWVRIFKKGSKIESVSFEGLLDEGLCFGWSESNRRSYDETSYLQKFTPRKKRGTVSDRNRKHVEELIRLGKMTQAGLDALGLQNKKT